MRARKISLAAIVLPLTIAWSAADAQSLLRIGESGAELIVAQGFGDTPHESVLRALDSAVSQVNGTQIAGVQLTVPAFNNSWIDGSAAVDSELVEFIARSFQGTVLSYKVLNITQTAEPPERMLSWLFSPKAVSATTNYVAEVEASVVTYKDDDASLGLLVTTSEGAVSSDLLDPGQLSDKVRTQLVNRLTAINKFNVIDPDRDEAFAQAYTRIASNRVSAAEQSVLGRQVAADIIINIDKVELLGHRTSVNFSGVDRSIETYKPDISVTYSLLDVGKGVVLFSNTLVRSAGILNTFPSDAALDNLLLTASEDIVVDFVNKEFPAQVLAVDGLKVTINRGEPFLAPGGVYSAIYLGAELIDPGTGRSLGRNERYCCQITISSTTSFIAQGEVTGISALESDPIVLVEPLKSETSTDQYRADETAFDIEDEFQLLE